MSSVHAVRQLRTEHARRSQREAYPFQYHRQAHSHSQTYAYAHKSKPTQSQVHACSSDAAGTGKVQPGASSVEKNLTKAGSTAVSPQPLPAANPIPRMNYTPLEVGLENLGNTCFMNSVLQCLLHVKPLVLYILSNDCMTDVNASSSTKGQVALALRDLVRLLYAAKSGSAVAPSNFRRAVGKWAPQLLDFQQQDSQEFLRFLLDALSNDLSRKTPTVQQPPQRKGSWHARLGLLGGSGKLLRDSKAGRETSAQQPQQQPHQAHRSPQVAPLSPSSTAQISGTRPAQPVPHNSLSSTPASGSAASLTPAQEQADQAWSKFVAANNSIITDLFAGQLASTVECLTCHHKSYCFDPFLDLSVPLPKANGVAGGQTRRPMFRSAGKCTLADCFRCLTEEEILEGSNAYMCEKCGQKRRAVRRLTVYRTPPVLVVHLKRFSYDIFSREKLETEVQFPLTGLDISPYLSAERRTDMPPASYNLVGVCNHMGGMRGGHYTAYAHLSEDPRIQGSWCLFNDRQTSVASSDRVCSQSAYVLFYQRQQP